MAQFVLVNVVVAVLMKHLEESHRQLEDDELDELERILEGELAYNGINPLCVGFNSILKVPNETVGSIKKVNSLPECTLPSTNSTNNLKESNVGQTCTNKLYSKTVTDSVNNTKKNQMTVDSSIVYTSNNNLKSNSIKNKIKLKNENYEETESSLLLPQKKIFEVNSP